MEFEKIRKLVSEILKAEEEDISMNTSFAKDLGADSLEIFQLMIRIEDTFDIQIPSEVSYNLKTVKDVVDYVKHPPV